MGREVTPKPVFAGKDEYKAGVEYVPDIVLESADGDVLWDNRADPDPWVSRITPCTSQELDREMQEIAINLTTAIGPRKGNKRDLRKRIAAETASRSQQVMEEIIAKHVTWLNEKWAIPAADGLPRIVPTNGTELVPALKDPRVDQEERETILGDLFQAIKDASHLEEGLAKKFVSRSGSQPAGSKQPPETRADSGVDDAAASVPPSSSEIPSAEESPTESTEEGSTVIAFQTPAPRSGTPVKTDVRGAY